ncbi:uncharacterized protein [Montipora foliosa]|uniref:uncharacterized protein n=1 Tax=Montipora foliosa TaxID=591990 RepID=UPI0035F135E3
MIEEVVGHIFTGFAEVVAGLHVSAVRKPSILSIAKYLIISVVVPGTAVIVYDDYFPIFEGVNLYLVLIIATPIMIVTPVLVFALFRFFGGKWLLNWHLKKTSRYLDFCQLPMEYKTVLLPKDSINWHYQLAGSSADHGFGFFPLPSSNAGIFPWSYPQLLQDVDVNMFYKPLYVSMESLIPTSPGYCKVVADQFRQDEFLQDCIVICGTESLLSGRLVSQKIGREFRGGNVEYNYPAMTFKAKLDGPRGKFRFDSDVVFGIKIQNSADVAYDWFIRVQNTFPNQLLNSVRALGCYIVHKHCLSIHSCHDFDWRITFAEAESTLFEHHADKLALKLCYNIIKFAVKQFSQRNNKSYPALKSYHLKTVILWIAEQSGKVPFDMYTINNNKTMGALLLHVISTYRQHIYSGYLQHYFIKDINILEPYGVEDRTAGMQLLDYFKMKPLSIVSNFDNANISRWKFEQFHIVSTLVAGACLWFNFYFSNIGTIFSPTSVVEQIYGVCTVFTLIMIVKIILD